MLTLPDLEEQRCPGAPHRFARGLLFIMQRPLSLHLCLIVVLCGVAVCQPTFPDGVSQVLENIRSRQPTASDDRAKVQQLIAAGSASLTSDVTDELLKSDFEKAGERDSRIRHVFISASLRGRLCENAFARREIQICWRMPSRYDRVPERMGDDGSEDAYRTVGGFDQNLLSW